MKAILITTNPILNMKRNVIVVLLITSFLIPNVLAINEMRVRDNMHISIPPNDYIYIDVVIPDDLGVYTDGEYEYVIESTAGSEWDDLTTQKVTTDISNTVVIPIQFRTYGKAVGTCTGPFEIILSSPELEKTKKWSGEVCISNYTDIDITPVSGRSGMDVLNDNMDLFDAAFVPERKVVHAGAETSVSLNVESYASLDFDITLGNELNMTAEDMHISVSKLKPSKSVYINITAPETPGEYVYTATVKADCSESFCERTIKGTLIVVERGKDLTDVPYTMTIFPTGINVKELKPIDYVLSIYNPGRPKTISVNVTVPEGLTTDFISRDISLSEGEEKRIDFTITPETPMSFNIVKIIATYGGKSRFITTQISTNEMLSDSMRLADDVISNTSGKAADVNAAMEDWMNKYKESSYGEELSDYTSLKDRLKATAKTNAAEEENNEGNLVIKSETEEETNPLFNPLIIAAIVVIAAIVIFVLYKIRSSQDIENMEIQ